MAEDSVVLRTAWLLTHDQEFIQQNAKLSAAVYPRGPLRYLVHLSLWYWNTCRAVIDGEGVMIATEDDGIEMRRMGTDAEGAITAWINLEEDYTVGPDALAMARQAGRKWLERRVVVVSMERATLAVEHGDLESARGFLNKTSLRDDREAALSLSLADSDHLKESQGRAPGAFPTGLKELDDAWDGGYRPGELGMIVAPTGVGKSMVLCYMAAEALWKGADVLYYTFELTPKQIRERISLGMLRRGRSGLGDHWLPELRAASVRLNKELVPFNLDVRGGSMTWPELAADLEDYKADRGKYPDVLILDSADDIAAMGKFQKEHESLKAAFKYLRLGVAEDKKIRVWTSGQLTRESVVRARINLRYIGAAFAKAQLSHYVLGFAQTEFDKEYEGEPRLNVFVLKDSLWGTPGAWLECTASFGRGKNGYPGLTVERTHQLPI